MGVRGDTSCPTAAEVAAALVGLVAPAKPSASASAAPAAQDVAELIAQGTSVSVRLTSSKGELIGEKRLPDTLSCAARARTAAVIVAAWETRLRGVTGPLAPVSNARATAAAATPPPVEAPRAPPAATAASAPAMVLAAPALALGPAPAGHAIQIETGVAALASITAAGLAPAALVEISWSRRDSAFALGLGALAVGAHATAVASGRGDWRRFGGLLDLKSSTRWTAVELQMHAGLALTALAINGQALPTTSSATIFDPGIVVGVRLRSSARRLAPWLEATAASWPRSHSLYVNGSTASVQLPPFEGLLGAGFSFGRGH